MNVVQFIWDTVTGFFPKWVPVEVLKGVLPIVEDAYLDGNPRLDRDLRAKYQAKLDDLFRSLDMRG